MTPNDGAAPVTVSVRLSSKSRHEVACMEGMDVGLCALLEVNFGLTVL
jgi:hypothetical protein